MNYYFENYERYAELDEGLKENLGLATIALMLSIPGNLKASDAFGIIRVSKSPTEVTQKIEEVIPQEFKDSLGFSKASAINIVARTLWAEAKGEGETGMRAVASIIWNRAYSNPENLSKICFAPKQFSCWNAVSPLTNPEYKSNKYVIKIPSDVPANKRNLKIWEDCKQIATEMVEGNFSPIPALKDANSYARTGKVPWKMIGNVTIGNHTFGTVSQRFYEYKVKNNDDASLELITKELFPASTFKDRSEFYEKIKKMNPALMRKKLKPGTIVRIPKKV